MRGTAGKGVTRGLWITNVNMLDKDVGFENLEPGE